MIAVYEIRCLVNNKVYVGQTINYKRRKQQHLSLLKSNKHENPYLQNDFNKYGSSKFTFKILEEFNDKEMLLDKEAYYIFKYGGINSDNTYNQQDKYHQSELSKQKNRLSNLGKVKYVMTDETKRKISIKNTGKVRSEAVKQLWSLQRKGKLNGMYGVHRYGNENPNYGNRKYSEKFINILREEFNSGVSKTELSRKYNIHNGTICNLINYGTSQHPRNYK